MSDTIKVLLQTTIPDLPETEDDWHIGRFSLLTDYLNGLRDPNNQPLCQVTTRNRKPDFQGHDPVLSRLADSDYDQLWLFAVEDAGNATSGYGLTADDILGLNAFHYCGGGILATRDHQDLGGCLAKTCAGPFHHFQTFSPEPDPTRHCPDDTKTTNISWPNYHSGKNGDYQEITLMDPVHPLLKTDVSPSGKVRYFPAHPHEGAVNAPSDDPDATIIAQGKSLVTDKPFNLAVAVNGSNRCGNLAIHSSFHHFADYNWNPNLGCPSFVSELPGDGFEKNPEALAEFKQYVSNLARWLCPAEKRDRLMPLQSVATV
ncbi:MAG: hypothetical protein KTR14_07770 [Vampirovibrio sp.]|nr:hypothetical protein [Vampirovibrio sp.]